MPDSLAPWLNDPTQMSPMTNLGLQLLANSNTPGGFGSIFGRSALQAGQDYQAAALRQQQIQQALLNQQIAQQKMAFLTAPGGMGGPQQAPQGAPAGAPAAPQGQQAAFAPGISQMPQQGQQFGFTNAQSSPGQSSPAQTPISAPNPFAPLSQQDIASIPIGGMSADWLARYQVGIENKSPLEAYQNVHKQQLELAQQQLAPKLASIDYLLKSDTPTKYMQADRQLMAAWPQIAQQAGLDPQKDYTDDGVRHALTFARNQLATSVGLPSIAPTNKLITKGIQQIDPVTGKVEREEELQQVVGPDGKPTLVPRNQAVGMTPFNASQAAAGSITDQAKELAYQRFKTTGEMPAAGKGGAAAQVAYANYFAKRAAEDGDTGAGLAARSQQYKASQGVVKDFTSGQTAKTLNGLNTAISHMDQLDQAATALNNGDVQALNKVSNFFKTQFGSDKTTNFNVVKNFAAGEVAKAVLPGGGGEHEREEIADAIKNSNSPEQLHNAIRTWRNLLAGKTDALRNQWDIGTNGAQGSFDKFLLPATKKALGIESTTSGPTGSATPSTNSKGWALHVDKNGNRAYVSPDGKSFEEVK